MVINTLFLEDHPLQFSYHDGKVHKICPTRREATWALNIKRGILSMLQSDSKTPSRTRTIQEEDVLGTCPTIYESKGASVLKRKDLNQCSNRVLGLRNLRSVPLPDKTPILDSRLECSQTFKDNVLAEVSCEESHLVTLFSRDGNGAKTQTQSVLKLLRVEADASSLKDAPEGIYVTNLLYEKETNSAKLKGEDVSETVRNLCLAPNMNFETADLFLALVFALRQLSAGALSDLWRRSSFKCRDNWQPLLDALPSCGTEACVGLMKDILISKELDDDKVEVFLGSLAFIPEPTAGMVASLTPLLQEPGASPSAYLAVTALIHHLCLGTRGCHDIPEVQAVMSILEEQLRDNCKTLEPEDTYKVQLVLRAIGNAGLAATSLTQTLASCAFLTSNPDATRVAAVEAFRRIPCAADRSALVHLYEADDEREEIRIASYYTAMRCPSQELLHIVRRTQRHEKSTQVGSFVWSHLSQLLESEDPLKMDMADSLPDDILSKEFEGESWKYSSYSDATVPSESVGSNMEAAVVFTPSSFIPRSVMANLTLHTMGRAVNALEVGVRLENAEDLLQEMLGHRSSPLSKFFGTKDEENKPSKSESPMEAVTKQTTKRYPDGGHQESKSAQQKMKRSKLHCQSGKSNELDDLQQKFNEGREDKKELRCAVSVKVFGNELIFLDCDGVRDRLRHLSLSMAGLAVRLLKGQEVQYNKRFILATEEVTFPTLSGFPVQLSLNATASTTIKIRGNMDFKQQSNFFINGYIKPSALIQLSAQMGTVGVIGKVGLKWVTGVKAMSSLDGGIQVRRGQELKVFLNTPEESMEILNFSSTLYLVSVDGLERISDPRHQTERRSCLNEEVSKLFGWQPCLEVSYPDAPGLLPFPLSGPAKASLILRKQDKGLRQYLLEASYNHVSQTDGWVPNEATCHFFMGTPKSEFKRDVGIDLHYNIQQRTFRMKLLHPKKKIQLDGKFESSRNSRNGHLELILDDKEVYYIKAMTDLQILAGEQRYIALAEIKPTKHGSPIVLSGNITKQFGNKMAFSIALSNFLKETTFLTVLIDKKADDKMKQYSMEGEVYVPGVFGSYAIGLLQQKGHIWSNALRVKYGLLGDAKNLRHECDAGQIIKMETDSDERYGLEIEHEFHCTQIQAFNHKVHLHHEEDAAHVHSLLEVSYGKHWDEINNKKKLFISQTFKNNSNPSASSYFMEFTMHVAEKQVNYRTQLIHAHSATESNTNLKVQYNDRMPFVAGLQWKDMSRGGLQKWEGALTTDTPWLYLYSALKLHQPQLSTYQTTLELTTGKALSIKNLVLDVSYKDKGSEKEGRVHLHTPTVTYLRASTANYIGGNTFRSYSEMASLWNHPLKNEIHLENNEKVKSVCFKIKGSRREFNLTADYRRVEWPPKSNFSVKTVWSDQKTPPLVLQLDGQIEEVKKEKMFYQKQGVIHFSHPFKMPVPQNILIQETFTVDKTRRRYILETKLVLDKTDESIQTIVLGYQPDNPYVCASLSHPYKHRALPNNLEVCASTKRPIPGKNEVEAKIKVNKKDVFGLTGKYQTKSSKKELWHVLRMDVTHAFQIRFPRVLLFDGEVFSRQSKLGDFDHGAWGKLIINKNDTLQLDVRLNGSLSQIAFYSQLTHPYKMKLPQDIQVRAAAKRYGARNANGTFSLHWGGNDVVVINTDFINDQKKNIGVVGLRASLHQVLTVQPTSAHFSVAGKVFPSRFSLISEIKIDEKSFLIDLLGSKEQKVGFVLSFSGNLKHNMDDLTVVPNLLSVDGSLKQKKYINEGYIVLLKNQELYRLHLRNRNVFGNGSLHNITLTFVQNGSQALPAEIKLRSHLQLEEADNSGQVCVQVDDRMLCVDILNAGVKEHQGVRGRLSHNVVSLQRAGIPMEGAVEVTLNNKSNNRTCTLSLDTGHSRIGVSVGLEKSSTQSQLMTSLKHNIPDLKLHGVPHVLDGICYYQSSSKRFVSGMTIYVEEEQLKAEVHKRSGGSSSDITLYLRNDLSAINNIVPSSIKISCTGEVTSNLFYSHCHGEIARQSLELSVPDKALFNGSLLTNGLKTNIFGLVSSGDAFARVNLNVESGSHKLIEIVFKHSLPQLNSLGVAKDNKIRFTATRQSRNGAALDITIGKCLVKVNGEAKTDNNGTASSSLNWTASVLNSCGALENLQFPKNLITNGSLQRNLCDFGLSWRIQYEGKGAKLNLQTSCAPYLVQGSLNHSIQHLTNLGLPPANMFLLSAVTGPSDLNIPTQSAVNGSLVINGCKSEFVCALTFNGNTSEVQVQTECQPRVKVEMVFRHNLLFLQDIHEESKLVVSVGKQANYDIDILLNSGNCTFEGKGDLHMDNKLQWKMLLENKCQAVKDLGAPLKIDGSGYIAINKKSNLDSQMLIVVDESALQGLLILKATEKKQELDAILTHNIQPAVSLGIPTKTVLDVTAERSGDVYRRSVQLSLDNKQITEEMSFTQKVDHIALSYKINHNLGILKRLLSEDKMEMKAVLDLKESKNASVTAQYGPYVMNATVQVKGNDTGTKVTSKLHHNWPWLLHRGVPASTQTSLEVQVMEGKQEISIQTAAERTLVIGTVGSVCTLRGCKVHLRSIHNSDAMMRYGYPKINSVSGRLYREGNRSSSSLDVELDKKKLSVELNSTTERAGSLEVTAGIKHSIPALGGLGVPSTSQVVVQGHLSNSDIAGIIKLNYDQRTNLFISANAKSHQQSNELNIKAKHNVPFLQQFLPKSFLVVTQANYSMIDAEGEVSVVVEEKELNVSAKFNYNGSRYSESVQLKHSVPQLMSLPAKIEIKTTYEKINKSCVLRHATVWGGRELALGASYTGQLPKLSGSHEINGNISHSLALPIPRRARASVYLEHSAHTHQDHIVIGWDGKDQVAISSSLRIRKERLDCRASLSHPFNFALRQLEVSSLSDKKESRYSQQTQIAWNKGQPVNFRIILEDKLTNFSKVCNACVTIAPGQVQYLLGVGNIQLCGSMEKEPNAFHESLDIRWDARKIRQNLVYETNRTPHPDSLQIDAIFENIFHVACKKQQISSTILTNFLDTLDHSLRLTLCDLPHPIVISGKHRLNAEELLKSETRFRFSSNESDDTLFVLALSDHGTRQGQNYSVHLTAKASDDVQIGLLGRFVSSSSNHQVLLQGRFDDKERWTLDASNSDKCLAMNVIQHVQGGSESKGVELSACMDPKHVVAMTSYLTINGTKQERLGQFLLTATDQGLSLSYQGCGDTIVRAETFFSDLGSQLKIRLEEMKSNIDSYVRRIQQSVSPSDSLYEAALWPIRISQDIAAILQFGLKELIHLWKESGLRQTLRHDLPVYFERVNNLVHQMQAELQKPLATLKDAYYDVTLKPLDEVWQEKTAACVTTIRSFLPSVVKDEWLMEPIRRLLDAVKAGLDVATHQLLKWTEAKLSRAVGKIRKPLANLFSSSSNCSVTMNFPVLSKEYPQMDLANMTHYIIEEKLMKPLKEMYSVNPMAEYYRYKRKMMESPFEYHALVIGYKHIVTFDGNIFDLTSRCSLLLAKDFSNNKFIVILNQGGRVLRSLHVEMNQVSLDIYPGMKIEENCQNLDLPMSRNGITVNKDGNTVEVSSEEGIILRCDSRHDVCSLTLEGWHHGVSAGLFGTNDNEARNDFLLPDHSHTNNSQDFSHGWQVDTQCSLAQKKVKLCPSAPQQKSCKALFQGAHSVLRNCFKVIAPAPFYSMCIEDICDSNEPKPVCTVAAAYVHLCNRNLVPIEIPAQCA
ncbi:uncharacterized protein O3C94_019109 [Discoglossus pictus]